MDYPPEDLLKACTQASPAGFILVNTDGIIEFINPRITEIFGYSENELLKQELEMLLPEMIRSKHKQLKMDFISHPSHKEMYQRQPVQGKTKDGKIVYLRIGLNPVQLNQRSLITATVIDITEEKKNTDLLKESVERLKRFIKELETFAYIVSHDFEKPLRKIDNYREILEKDLGPSLQGDALNNLYSMKTATDYLKSLIYELLEYTYLSTRAEKPRPINLNEVLDHVIKSHEDRIKSLGANVQIDQLTEIEAEPKQIYTLFEELIENSLKFCKKDVPLNIHIYGEDQGDIYQIMFVDNGIGFDMKYAEKVLQVFQTLISSGSLKGMGMGLPICKKITLLHKGDFYIADASREGIKICIKFPKKQVNFLEDFSDLPKESDALFPEKNKDNNQTPSENSNTPPPPSTETQQNQPTEGQQAPNPEKPQQNQPTEGQQAPNPEKPQQNQPTEGQQAPNPEKPQQNQPTEGEQAPNSEKPQQNQPAEGQQAPNPEKPQQNQPTEGEQAPNSEKPQNPDDQGQN